MSTQPVAGGCARALASEREAAALHVLHRYRGLHRVHGDRGLHLTSVTHAVGLARFMTEGRGQVGADGLGYSYAGPRGGLVELGTVQRTSALFELSPVRWCQ